MSNWYELIGQTVVPLEIDWTDPASILQLSQFNEPTGRRVAETDVLGVRVSTVFLGLDHSFLSGAPILFESMAFWPGEHGNEQDRCGVEWCEAEAMHARMCAEVVGFPARLRFIGRAWSQWWRDARVDFARRWKDLRGIELTDIERLTLQIDERIGRDSSPW
jgi:hypothetical protein